MHVVSQVWCLPKNGSTPAEYEDAFYPDGGLDFETKFCQFAVADGATETSFSGLWARFLVSAYCHGELSEKRLWRSIAKYRRRWFKAVTSNPLPWYAEEKLRMGAFSSLAGLTVHAPTETKEVALWEALAIGDSCLFQVRKEEFIVKWPLDSSSQFGYHPILVSSNATPGEESTERRITGEWTTGDWFYLMTDAIALWYLERVEKGAPPHKVIPNFELDGSSQAFSDWISNLRDSGEMRNDDVTLMRVVLT